MTRISRVAGLGMAGPWQISSELRAGLDVTSLAHSDPRLKNLVVSLLCKTQTSSRNVGIVATI